MTTTTTAAPSSVAEVDPQTAKRWIEAGEAVLIDVREPDEHAAERIADATLLPLSRFDARQVSPPRGARVIFHCRSGRRSADACRLAASLAASGVPVYSLAGGIEAWKKAGQPIVAASPGSAPGLSILRQVQITVGAGVLLGCLLAWLVHPVWLILPAFFGAGLVVAGATGTCGLAALLARMPWNRIAPHS